MLTACCHFGAKFGELSFRETFKGHIGRGRFGIQAGMKWIVIVPMAGLLGLGGCSSASRSPDAIRQNTANITAAAARNTRAVAQGVVDGLRTKGPLNINRAGKEQLKSLPGIDSLTADRIIAGRPYKNSVELQKRHLITKAEYNRIANKIEAR